MQSIGDFDATIAAAGYRVTEITQEHAPQKEGWVPVKPGPKQKEREHMSAEKVEVGVGPS